MIVLNPESIKLILKTLAPRQPWSNKGMRVIREGEHVTMGVDRPRPGDRITTYSGSFGSIALMLSPEVESKIGTVVVDVDDGPKGEHLVVHAQSPERSIRKGASQ